MHNVPFSTSESESRLKMPRLWSGYLVILTFPIEPFIEDFRIDCEFCLKLSFPVFTSLINVYV